MSKTETISLLKQYIILLKMEGISVDKAFLFGSYSNETQTEDSDIDLMIVTDEDTANNDRTIGKMWKLTRKISTKIEPFLVDSNRFLNSEDSPLIDQVKKSGIEII